MRSRPDNFTLSRTQTQTLPKVDPFKNIFVPLSKKKEKNIFVQGQDREV